MLYNIANLVISVEGEQLSYVNERMKKYLINDCNIDVDFTVAYVKCENIELPLGESMGKIANLEWVVDDNGLLCAYNKIDNFNQILCKILWNDNLKRADIYAFDTCPFGGVNFEEKIFNLIGTTIAYGICKYDAIAFHSSAFSYLGNGILLSAPPETGKSTHTLLWKKMFGNNVTIINDDMPFIRRINNQFRVFGSPWSGKSMINKNCSANLKAVICIRQSESNYIDKLNNLTSFYYLYNETKKCPDAKCMDLTVELINDIIKSVPVYEFGCNISEEAVLLLKKTLKL